MFLIVTVDRNWAIGKNNSLLYDVPAIIEYRRQNIREHTVICGRKSYETIYRDVDLDSSKTIVLTRNQLYRNDKVVIAHSIEEIPKTDDTFVIGGASIYNQLYTSCKYAIVTYVDSVTLYSDAYFPNLSKLPNWEKIIETPTLYFQGLPYTFITYLNKAVE